MCINAGSSIDLGSLVYNPPRNGATLWEIGVPDRTAAEFFVPAPPPEYNVHVYQNNVESMYDRKMFNGYFEYFLVIFENIVAHSHLFLVCRFRQYGLWEQYGVLYPKNDLVYNVGTSNYSKDWFFAHVTRYVLYPMILVFEVYFYCCK